MHLDLGGGELRAAMPTTRASFTQHWASVPNREKVPVKGKHVKESDRMNQKVTTHLAMTSGRSMKKVMPRKPSASHCTGKGGGAGGMAHVAQEAYGGSSSQLYGD